MGVVVESALCDKYNIGTDLVHSMNDINFRKLGPNETFLVGIFDDLDSQMAKAFRFMPHLGTQAARVSFTQDHKIRIEPTECSDLHDGA